MDKGFLTHYMICRYIDDLPNSWCTEDLTNATGGDNTNTVFNETSSMIGESELRNERGYSVRGTSGAGGAVGVGGGGGGGLNDTTTDSNETTTHESGTNSTEPNRVTLGGENNKMTSNEPFVVDRRLAPSAPSAFHPLSSNTQSAMSPKTSNKLKMTSIDEAVMLDNINEV